MVSAPKNKILKVSELSLVIPVFNEEQGIKLLAQELHRVASQLPLATEVIFVNDGSTDKTTAMIQKIAWKWPVKIIELSRNFGHQSALLAGLEAAQGHLVVTLDSDLQHPPSLIPQLCHLAREGYDIVLTQRIDTTVIPLKKRVTSKLFYFVMSLVSNTEIPMNTSDFRLLKRAPLNHLLAMPEHSKFLRGMVNWIGFKSVIVPFEVGQRATGESKYSLKQMVGLAFHGVTSFSVMPLYFSVAFSLVMFGMALVYALYVLYVRFITNSVVDGWASVLFVLLVLGGFITLFLGLIGSYLAAIFEEVKHRPAYIKRRETNL